MSDIDTILKRLDAEIDGIRYAIKYTNAISEMGLVPLPDYDEKQENVESADGSECENNEDECYDLHIDLDQNSIDRHVKILKSSCLLMLYCICESIIREAMDFVNEYIDRQSNCDLHYDMCSESIKKMLLRRIVGKNVVGDQLIANVASCCGDISCVLMQKWDAEHHKFYTQGNIDAKKINEVFNEYGILPIGEEFLKSSTKIKGHRNSISHGEKSFFEAGREVSIKDLLDYARDIHKMLKKSLENIKKYIDSHGYQRDDTGTPSS